MRFTVQVAADLYGQKVNLELSFPQPPTMADLTRLVETTFAVESSALRPPAHPFIPFKVVRFQVFDERLQQWVDLVASNQIMEMSQIYAFQKDNIETQQQIPPARLPTSTGTRSPMRQVSTAPQPATYNPSPITASRFQAAASPLHRTAGTPPGPRLPAAQPQAASKSRTFSDTASFDSKVRVVFDEFDANGNRVIETEEFRRLLRVLNIDLSAATISDLFNRADVDRDGVLSLSEFQAFAVYYPTLIDSLYFRSKEYWEDQSRREMIEAQQRFKEECRQKELQAQQLHQDARNDLVSQESKLQLQEKELQARLLAEREARNFHLESKKETEKAQYARVEKERDLAGGRERERQKHAAVVESQRATEAAQRRLAAQEGELSRAQEKERQLEALLAEARRETERQLKGVQIVSEELMQTRDREQSSLEMFAEIQKEVQHLSQMLSAGEMDYARTVEKEKESEGVLTEAQRETARASHRRDEEERELALQRERETHHARLAQEAARAIDDADRALSQMEQDYADRINRRQQIEQQEMPLLEQEIRLREQRFALEQCETQLKTEAISFQSSVGRSPLPGASPMNYSATQRASPMRSPMRR